MRPRSLLGLVLVAMLGTACAQADESANAPVEQAGLETAYFAGGCFWCTEADFEKLDGVAEAVSGYMGGKVASPSYKEVSRGTTGHTEAVRVRYDPAVISYRALVAFHWRNIDPTVANRQFCDRGSQYRSGIYYRDDAQARIARDSLETMQQRFDTVHTEVEKATTFYPAEDYHQDYADKNPLRYQAYRFNCGRDARLKKLWGDEAGKLPADAG
ncbi:peptide-methionine (S)-S-oxide reductase MsrA [Algiphilus sp.]|uniref:peptide-methionine (S)-S-oxide reductase MsrA n=1 Tax=Algiphilus sp. TaxID=1872431 RepID=UPI003BAB4653